MEDCVDICSPNIFSLSGIYSVFPSIDIWGLIPCYYSKEFEVSEGSESPSVVQGIHRVPTLLESINFVA